MDEFYDKEKFTGKQPGSSSGGRQTPPPRPPQKKQDNSGWYSWPLIIILFAVGAWPLALILAQKKRPERRPSGGCRQAGGRHPSGGERRGARHAPGGAADGPGR